MTPLPDGWLTDDEAELLARLAVDQTVLELGAWKGRSTVVLAATAALVVSVDRHRPFDHYGEAFDDDTLPGYLEAVRPLSNVVPVVGEFDVAALFRPDAFGLVFLDGLHDPDSVAHDIPLAFRFDCTVACHDWGRFAVEPVIRAAGHEPSEVVGSIAVFL